MFNLKFKDLFNPTLAALNDLGGSASVSEIEERVAMILSLSDEEINDIHRDNITKLSYRLAWARNYLKRCGLIENSSRGVWSLTNKEKKTITVDQNNLVRQVQAQYREKKQKNIAHVFFAANHPSHTLLEVDDSNIDQTWQEDLLHIIQQIKPEQFERLCQRLLRELGFVNVEVIGKTNDGGIDGKGVIRLGGVMSFHIVFQAKRYKGSVPPSVIRDFRGAMIGRADKGLIMTTGSFTREARKEAQRDGSPPIDLIDGNDLAQKLKDLNLGVKVKLVEEIQINSCWFNQL